MAKKAEKKPVVVTKKMIAESLAEGREGMSKKAAMEIVNFVFEEMAKTIKKGGTVDINGFGKFVVKERKGRVGINPQTKEKIKIAASKTPSFKASKTLKDAVK